jgi:hypothetical protein
LSGGRGWWLEIHMGSPVDFGFFVVSLGRLRGMGMGLRAEKGIKQEWSSSFF